MQEDAFEQSPDQVFFYNYSSQIPSPTIKRKICRESPPRLQLQRAEPSLCIDVPKRKKGVYQTSKIIKIGNVTFKSNFQSGNIGNAQQLNANTYVIQMQKQSNSLRTSAWFYFSVEGVKGEANFIIRGFTKHSSLYNQGMKICYKDTKEGKWRRGGTHISYGPTPQTQPQLFQLRYTHFFKTNQYTCVQFAYCFPYSFRHLIQSINSMQNFQLMSLGKSRDGRDIPLLTIGNSASSKVMFFSARVHPGETVSSFIMDGFLQQLVSESDFAKLLRKQFQIKVVPMLNPDGVVRGNYRFSSLGQDLNRRWINCKQSDQPQIYNLRELIRRTKKQKEVVLYIDIHGHSRKKNVFFYGCSEGRQGVPARQFPYFMEKMHDAFSYESSSFAVQKDKEGTARITMWRQLKIHHVYTLEASFCGTPSSNYLDSDYSKVGRKLCEGVAAFFCTGDKKQMNKQMARILLIKQKANQQLKSSQYLMNVGQNDNSGSDSEPQKGQVVEQQKPISTTISFNRTQPTPKKSFTRSIPTTKFRVERLFTDDNKQFTSKVAEYTRQVVKTMHHPQIKLSTNLNKYDLDSLNSSSLHQRNIRVHSMSRATNRLLNKIAAANEQNEVEERKIDLMHAKEGAQYRRVRKMAEAHAKKQFFIDNNREVQCLFTQQISLAKSKTIAPRFYPVSQQRTRRTTGELRKYEGKKISVNGDEINVQCLGNKITLA